MAPIHQLIPNADELLALEPEELAPVLLEYIVSGSASALGTRQSPISRGNVFAQRWRSSSSSTINVATTKGSAM